MENNVTKAKRRIARFSWEEFIELKRWMRKKEGELWIKEKKKRRRERMEAIKALPSGALVVYTDQGDKLCGKVGKIVRHLERGSVRTIVDFGEDKTWNVPRRNLSANVSEENLRQLEICNKLTGIGKKAFGKIVIPE